MQEFMFRGKSKDDDGWIIGTGLVHKTDYHGMPVDRYFIINGSETNDYDIGYSYEVKPETVGQFIGRCDVNGKKIFTGDIVEFAGHKLICVVKWTSEYGISLIGRGEHPYFKCSMHPGNNYEVVGNIFDNPELLE